MGREGNFPRYHPS